MTRMRQALGLAALALVLGGSPSGPPAARREQPVRFVVAGDTLAGSLSVPEGRGPFPAVILVSGGGQDDRDGRLGDFRPFRILAESLSVRGVAVLRYDDRGIGGSGGRNTWQYTPAEHAEEPVAALSYLRSRSDIDPDGVGFLGHSYGTLVVVLAVQRGADPRFVVLLSPPGGPYARVQAGFQRRNALGTGKATAEADGAAVFEAQTFGAAVRGALDWHEVERLMRDRVRRDWLVLPDSARARWSEFDTYFASTFYGFALRFGPTPWMREFWDFDPLPAYRQLRAPVLAVFGDGDPMCPMEENWPPLRQALAESGNPDVTGILIPMANHYLQAPRLSRVDFAPDVVPQIAGWIVSHAAP